MRILVHDFGGYGFPFQLSRELAARGHEVGHGYCASLTTTPNTVDGADSAVDLMPLHTSSPVDKYSLLKRWSQEVEYGRVAANACERFAPEVVISANTPLSAQARLLGVCRRRRIPFVFWLQDLLGIAAYRILRRKQWLLGISAGGYFRTLESRLLRQSSAVVCISDDFVPVVARMGVPVQRISVIENWGVLPEAKGDLTDWAAAHGLGARPILLYSGTLSMKHNPDLLLRLAHALRGKADIAVVSQGQGADWLVQQKLKHPLNNLIVLPYQPAAQLPAMYAAAEILVAVLTEDASQFSVPSKVLTYLCAGRPILAAIPNENLAARIILSEGAGSIVSPDEPDSFVAAAEALLADAPKRMSTAAAARDYARRNFDISRIAARFESVINDIVL